MKNNLIKILGILTLLAIPKNINENYPIKRVYETKIEEKGYNQTEYKTKINEVEDKINSLNIKKGFFSDRLEQKDVLLEIREGYIKKLRETEKELLKYQKEKDSIYRLIKK